MKIGLFGGSFDPIHYGHLILAQTALVRFGLGKVIFIPAKKPPHKLNVALVSGYHRLNMIKIAIKHNSCFSVTDYELKTNHINYTFKTIEYFLKLYPGDSIHFVMGPDLLSQLHSWGNSEKLLKLCRFLVGINPEYPAGNIQKNIIDKVTLFGIPPVGISSTLLRNNLKKGLSIKYLTPEKVEDYILKNKLYI